MNGEPPNIEPQARPLSDAADSYDPEWDMYGEMKQVQEFVQYIKDLNFMATTLRMDTEENRKLRRWAAARLNAHHGYMLNELIPAVESSDHNHSISQP
jgi:hypothetical protein